MLDAAHWLEIGNYIIACQDILAKVREAEIAAINDKTEEWAAGGMAETEIIKQDCYFQKMLKMRVHSDLVQWHHACPLAVQVQQVAYSRLNHVNFLTNKLNVARIALGKVRASPHPKYVEELEAKFRQDIANIPIFCTWNSNRDETKVVSGRIQQAERYC